MGAQPIFLVTGAAGQLGYELVRELAPLGRVVAPERAALDLADADGLRRFVRECRPSVILNAGAYTAVDRAESDREVCEAVNAEAPGVLGEEARALGAAVVHFSTDYVFDGRKRLPYVETDATGPLSVYGATKLRGEQALAASGAAHLVFRTSWVYALRGRNFLLTMLGLARARTELRVVNDQCGAPTWARMVAGGTCQALRALLERERWRAGAVRDAQGVYHISAAGVTSWHGFAEALLAQDPRREEQRCERVVPITTSEYPTPASRPAYSALDCSKLRETFGVRLPDWREQLSLALHG